MGDICGQRRGKTLIPFSDEDAQELYKFPENQFLEISVKGSKKERSYKQLCLYWSSVNYLAGLELSLNLNSPSKVDYLTRLKLNFVKETVFDSNGLLHWIVKPLNYAECDQPEAAKFISDAIDLHAEMVGVDTKTYKKELGGDKTNKS